MGSTDRPPHPGGETDTASSPEASAVLYVCAERSKEIAGLSTQRAADEGRSFAEITSSGSLPRSSTRTASRSRRSGRAGFKSVAWRMPVISPR